jgi:endonuclease/exonuclease/phosphatase family metal-dependent hydrolase
MARPLRSFSQAPRRSRAMKAVGRARLRRALLGGLLLVAGLVAGLGAVATPTPTASATGEIRLLQFNMCGRVCPWPTQLKTAAVIDSLDQFRPAAVSLNEVCRSEFSRIVSGIASRGWKMSAAFLVTRNGACNDGTDYGNAVLTRAEIGTVDRTIYSAQGPDHNEFRGLLCVTADLGMRPTRICSTHIVNSGPDPTGSIRRRQIAQAASLVGAHRGPVVLMGDFNLPPGDQGLDRIYTRAHPGGVGAFDEVDQGPVKCRCGAVTQRSGEKIDYVFVTARDFDTVKGRAIHADFSDHASLRGWVTKK